MRGASIKMIGGISYILGLGVGILIGIGAYALYLDYKEDG